MAPQPEVSPKDLAELILRYENGTLEEKWESALESSWGKDGFFQRLATSAGVRGDKKKDHLGRTYYNVIRERSKEVQGFLFGVKRLISNTQNDPETPSSILCQEWRYPRLLETAERHIAVASQESWESLEKDDLVFQLALGILDPWLALLSSAAAEDNTNIFVFKSLDHQLLLSTSGPLRSLLLDSWQKDIWQKDIWLLPIISDYHRFSLLVVVPTSKTFLYMDPLHRQPPEHLLQKLCKLMNAVPMEGPVNNIDWSQWTLYVPDDYPKQREAFNDSMVHVCCWAWVICRGLFLHCATEGMEKVRRVIATALSLPPIPRPEEPGHHIGVTFKKARNPSKTTHADVQRIDGPPPGHATTMKFCASLLQVHRRVDDN